MNTFLHHVALDMLGKYGTNMSRIAVVFPNKRASLFLNEELARLAGKPLWSPAYITISDLFRHHSTLTVADPIKLVSDLHKTYMRSTGKQESLDKFYGWGQLLIADFDDIDKNMADADKVFANLRDLHELDDISYLTDGQKTVLRRFFGNFVDHQESYIKRKFIELWSHFTDIYKTYNQQLRQQHLAYEGALYRDVVSQDDIPFQYDLYLFVGFNMMQQVELRLCDRLRQAGKAKFYWDFDDSYMHGSEAGHFIARYLDAMPNELDSRDEDIYQNMAKPKNIRFIAASTENIQARYVADWLLENHGERIGAGSRTAIVLCNEGLLPDIIHSLPDEVENLNVTTGYPLSQAPVTALVDELIELQTRGYNAKMKKYRLRGVMKVLNHPYSIYLADSEDSIKAGRKQQFYFSAEELAGDDKGLQLLFRHPDSITHWLAEMLRHVGMRYHQTGGTNPFFQESLFRMYTLVNRLCALIDQGDLVEDLEIWRHLLDQIVATTTIPFHGEPVVGTQVMGVLETRNLDFDHVLLLSANEGNMPRHEGDSSFIPYTLRQAYGLTTIDHKVAIYAYYFHRLLQRARDITICYNQATTDGQTGEMSRFMLQWLVECPHPIRLQTLTTGQKPVPVVRGPIEKDEAVSSVLNAISRLSPSALNVYIRCQLRFFYQFIAHIIEPDTPDADDIDNRTFGNIFHKSAELLYRPFVGREAPIQKSELEAIAKDKVKLQTIVDEAFRQVFFGADNHTRPEYNGLQFINRQVLIDYLRQLVTIDASLAPFRILGLEYPIEGMFPVGDTGRDIKIHGFIDRMDAIEGGKRIRIVDYKTGANNKMRVGSVEEIFTGENLSNHTDYYLQTMLYSLMAERKKHTDVKVSPALLFIQHSGGKDYDPTIILNKERILDISTYGEVFTSLLQQLLGGLFDTSQPFIPTNDPNRCLTCPYALLCGRPVKKG